MGLNPRNLAPGHMPLPWHVALCHHSCPHPAPPQQLDSSQTCCPSSLPALLPHLISSHLSVSPFLPSFPPPHLSLSVPLSQASVPSRIPNPCWHIRREAGGGGPGSFGRALRLPVGRAPYTPRAEGDLLPEVWPRNCLCPFTPSDSERQNCTCWNCRRPQVARGLPTLLTEQTQEVRVYIKPQAEAPGLVPLWNLVVPQRRQGTEGGDPTRCQRQPKGS